MRSKLGEFVGLVIQEGRQAKLSGDRVVDWGCEDHIQDLEARVADAAYWRDVHPRGSEKRGHYKGVFNNLKRELHSARRHANRLSEKQSKDLSETAVSDDVKLIKEYIQVLLEDDGGVASAYADAGITASDISAASGVGSGSGTAKQLSSVFLTPFTDVFKTAVGKSKEVSRKARTLLTVGFRTILSTLIPGLGVRYEKIFAQEEKDIAKIRSQYKDVYDRTEKSLSSNDAAFLAFMASPERALSGWVASKSPAFVGGLLSTITGGLSDDVYESFKSSSVLDKLSKKVDDFDREISRSEKKKSNESQMIEADADSKSTYQKEVLSNPAFLAKALDNSDVDRMKQEAVSIYRKSLKDVFNQAKQAIESTNSMEELEKLVGKDIKTESFDSPVGRVLLEIRLLNEEDEKASEQVLIKSVRDSVKKFYTDKLEKQVEEVLRSGIPEDSQFVQDYKKVIEKIKSL